MLTVIKKYAILLSHINRSFHQSKTIPGGVIMSKEDTSTKVKGLSLGALLVSIFFQAIYFFFTLRLISVPTRIPQKNIMIYIGMLSSTSLIVLFLFIIGDEVVGAIQSLGNTSPKNKGKEVIVPEEITEE